MLKNLSGTRPRARISLRRAAALTIACIAAVGAVFWIMSQQRAPIGARGNDRADVEGSSQFRQPPRYFPTAEQWNMLTVEPVATRLFRAEHATEGKIAINEDRSTPVFSPYPGRVTRLVAKPGDFVEAGQPLFFVEAADMVQAQNDFMAAVATVNKAQSRVALAEIVEKQNRRLLESKAGSLRDSQVAETDVAQARSELRVAKTALEAAHNRLRILGKTDEEIATFQDKGQISPDTPIHAPISGTVVQRKLGPGQFVSYTSTGSLDPAFVIGDLSTVWVVAYVRESEAPKIRVGQKLEFKVMAYPDRVFQAEVNYVAASLDTATRRLLVRATVDNTDNRFKPEMFASVAIFADGQSETVAVPRDAVIVESGRSRVWIVREDRSIEQQLVTTGLASGTMVEVLDGLRPGDRIVTKGGIFVDRAARS